MDYPKRKRLRLEYYDYNSPGAYFVTICTREKRFLFWETSAFDSVGAATSRPPNAVSLPAGLTAQGKIVEDAIQNIEPHYSDVAVDRYVIMPNHIHLLIQTKQRAADSRPYELSTVIGHMKRWASAQAGVSLWQRSYHDHVIRNEQDYCDIWQYIENNPARWEDDCFYQPERGV